MLWHLDRPDAALLDERRDLGVVPWSGVSEALAVQRFGGWRTAGYRAAVGLSLGLDAGALYSSGAVDGMAHPGEVVTDGAGLPIGAADRPWVFPTAGWIAFLKSQARRAVDQGAEAIWLDDIRLPLAGSQSLAFRAAWETELKTPWRSPESSPADYFRSSRLKCDLLLRGADDLVRATRDYARERGRTIEFLLPLASPLDGADQGFLAPVAGLSRLAVDGIVGRISAPSVGTPTGPTAFEAGWAQSTYFANLVEELPTRRLYFAPAVPAAAKPGEAPSTSWRDALVASLLAARANGYAAVPSERATAPAVPGALDPQTPSALPEGLPALLPALRDVSGVRNLQWIGGTRGVGVLTLETLPWQMGGPQGSHPRSHWGLLLPLLRRGIAAELVPMERVAEPQFLSRFKVLLLSYEMQKPLFREANEALAKWVQAGGALVVLGGDDPYNRIDEWWEKLGYSTPTDHLLRECQASVEPMMRAVRLGGNRFHDVLRTDDVPAEGETLRRHIVPLLPTAAVGAAIHVRFTAAGGAGPEGGARVGRVRIVEGGRVRADFIAGSAAERPFLAEEHSATAGPAFRSVAPDGSFVYRFRRLSANAVMEVDLSSGTRVSLAGDGDPTLDFQSVGRDLPSFRLPSRVPLALYPLMGAQPLYQLRGEEGAPAWISPARSGWVVYCGVPAGLATENETGAELVRSLTRLACTRVGLPYQEGSLLARRGSYVAGHAVGRKVQLTGSYLDLLQPDLPLRTNPELAPDQPVLLKEVALLSRSPVLLHATHRTRVQEGALTRMRVVVEAAAGVPPTLRIFLGGMGVASCRVLDSQGRRLRADQVGLKLHVEGRTLLVQLLKPPSRAALHFSWLRPEARFSR